jgi:hypothetical protein
VPAKEKRESIWIKIYIAMLFLCGIGLWCAICPVDKHKVTTDAALDEKIVTVLAENGIVKDNVLSKYAKQRNAKATKWNEFCKTIKLKIRKNLKKPTLFESKI